MTLPLSRASTGRHSALASQPVFASIQRATDALAAAGAPLPQRDVEELHKLMARDDTSAEHLVEAFNRHVLFSVELDAQGFGTPARGEARPDLDERGWRSHVVQVLNPHGHVALPRLLVNPVPSLGVAPTPGELSPSMTLSQLPEIIDRVDKSGLVADIWLNAELDDDAPLTGFPVEYRVVHLYSSTAGNRVGRLGLTLVDDTRTAIFTGSQALEIPFDARGSFDVKFDIRDHDGETCMASLTVRDSQGRIYPPLAMRVAPDMRFHPHVYRASGETLRLPAGRYNLTAQRGPEYLATQSSFEVTGEAVVVPVRLERWFEAPSLGWYPGDPHLHAAGCSHYANPTVGVRPETMIRHVRGEALSIGSVLTWGPGYYHQKQFFTGTAVSPKATLEYPELQQAMNQSFDTTTTSHDPRSTLRYDIEVSGFPSSHLGHVMLLNLREQDFPGVDLINDWPSYTLPVMRWAKAQGATVGYAHCGLGMGVSTDALPNYEMPRFKSIGTNEAIVDVVHGVVDFLAGAESQPAAELNAWYHLLNCGFRLAMVGETDYPCIFDERPGIGRSYVKLESEPVGDLGWQKWIAGLEAGHLYFGDGRTHFPSFSVHGASSGEIATLSAPGSVRVDIDVAALLEADMTAETQRIRTAPSYAQPAWHVERARIAGSREVPVEVVVNGQPVITTTIVADGSMQHLSYDLHLVESSWIAVRVLPSGHTHPVFVEVAEQPVRASRRSARWCRAAVDTLWQEKGRFVRPEERAEAAHAFDVARDTYDLIATESPEGS